MIFDGRDNLYYTSSFEGCSKLTNVIIPEGMAKVPEYAFRNLSALKSVSLPSNFTNIGWYAFMGCSGLTEVDLPVTLVGMGSYAFADCTGLRSIAIPEGYEKLNNHTFKGCTGLTEVSLPNSLTTINSYAFSGCTGLTAVQLPDSITTMSGRAFYNCTNLSSVNIPISWISTPDYDRNSTSYWSTGSSYYTSPFEGCSKLHNLILPDGMPKVPDYAFRKCTIKNIKIADSVFSIGKYAFDDCAALRNIDASFISLTTIGQAAFRNCHKLSRIEIMEKVSSIGSDAFTGCSNIAVYCPEKSYSAISLIENNVPIVMYDSVIDSSANKLNIANSFYLANTVSARANGYVTMNLAYEFKDEVKSSVSGLTLKIRTPSNSTLIEKTLMLDGVRMTGYDYNNNLLTVALSKPSGTISFDISPTSDSKLSSYALLTFKCDGNNMQEIIGVINEDIPHISIQSDDEVSTQSVEIKGVGPSDSDVSLYVDGELSKTVHTNKSGSYETVVSLSNPQNYTTYNISAKALENGSEVSANKEVTYCSTSPNVNKFTMNYEGKTYDLQAQGTSKPVVTFVPNKTFEFNVDFTNTEQIDKVYVCSTRSNVTKRIEAVWNESKKTYTAKGLFDPSNTSYVPGTLTVEYSPKEEKLSFANGIDFTSDKYVNGSSNPIKAVLAGKMNDCIQDLHSEDNKLSGIIKLVDVDAQLDFNILTDIIPSFLDPQNAGEYGYEPVEDDLGVKIYMKLAENCEDKVRGEIIDFASGKLTEFLIEGKYTDAAMAVDSYFEFVQVLGYADKLVKWNNNRVDINEAKQSILASNMSDAEKAEALKKLEYASKANNGVVATMALSILLTAAGIAIPFPASLILPLIAMKNTNYVKGVLGQFNYLNASGNKSAGFDFRWKIDPSGYVYDDNTNKKLSGVTVTTYWIPSDGSDNFFDNIPSLETYGTIWDASEWDQVNPLITDSEGRYSWDVPEGWWRVKCEKNGYETTWSDWLPVPPPQTNVNIGMKRVNQIGDTNLDGKITISDVTAIQRHLAELELFTDEQIALADTNGDGEINIIDATHLQKYLAEFDGIVLGRQTG